MLSFFPRDVLDGWLVGCFGFNGPLTQYFSLYRAVSQREGERRERIDESKNVQTTPPAPTASEIGPCPTVIKIVGRPGTGSLSSTIAPPVHPRDVLDVILDLIESVSEGFPTYSFYAKYNKNVQIPTSTTALKLCA